MLQMPGNDFVWANHPLNKFEYAVGASVIYISLILLHTAAYYKSSPPKLGDFLSVQKIHNIILSGGSLFVFSCCLYEVIQRSNRENSSTWLLCEHVDTRVEGSLWFWSFIYYLSKYYELLDTVLQLAQGKIPPNYFLHVYHHSCVILMGWVWVNSGASIQFIGLLFNCFVHVVMYYYFYLKSIGISPWWKKYVTTLQIVQFITSFGCLCGTLYMHHALGMNCKGMNIVYGSLAFNATLLYGFIVVLGKSDKPSKSAKKNKD